MRTMQEIKAEVSAMVRERFPVGSRFFHIPSDSYFTVDSYEEGELIAWMDVDRDARDRGDKDAAPTGFDNLRILDADLVFTDAELQALKPEEWREISGKYWDGRRRA